MPWSGIFIRCFGILCVDASGQTTSRSIETTNNETKLYSKGDYPPFLSAELSHKQDSNRRDSGDDEKSKHYHTATRLGSFPLSACLLLLRAPRQP